MEGSTSDAFAIVRHVDGLEGRSPDRRMNRVAELMRAFVLEAMEAPLLERAILPVAPFRLVEFIPVSSSAGERCRLHRACPQPLNRFLSQRMLRATRGSNTPGQTAASANRCPSGVPGATPLAAGRMDTYQQHKRINLIYKRVPRFRE